MVDISRSVIIFGSFHRRGESASYRDKHVQVCRVECEIIDARETVYV